MGEPMGLDELAYTHVSIDLRRVQPPEAAAPLTDRTIRHYVVVAARTSQLSCEREESRDAA